MPHKGIIEQMNEEGVKIREFPKTFIIPDSYMKECVFVGHHYGDEIADESIRKENARGSNVMTPLSCAIHPQEVNYCGICGWAREVDEYEPFIVEQADGQE